MVGREGGLQVTPVCGGAPGERRREGLREGGRDGGREMEKGKENKKEE